MEKPRSCLHLWDKPVKQMQLGFHLYLPALIRHLGLSSGLFYFVTTGLAQTTTKIDTTVFTIVEKAPAFPGGFSALKEYVQSNLRYPPQAQKAGIKGRVLISFIVEPNGQITSRQLVQGLGYGCDEEALRLVQIMPCCWLPGSQSGQPLRVKYTLPILFGIDYPKVKVR